MIGSEGTGRGEPVPPADLLQGVLIALAVAGVWVVLGFANPTVTYHLAPLVAGLAPVVTVRIQRAARISWPTTIAALAGGAGAATVGALMLGALGALGGPTFAAWISIEAELILMISLSVAGGIAVARFGAHQSPPAGA